MGQMGGQASWGSMSGHDRMSPHMKWKTSREIHASYITTGFYSLHQKLVFPCVWVSAKYRTGYQPNPVKPTPGGSDSKTMPQEDNGLVITQHQGRKTSLGWINRKLWLLPWMSTGASTEDGWRFQKCVVGMDVFLDRMTGKLACIWWRNRHQPIGASR